MYRRIRDLRTDNDMTQSELAKLLGMSQTGYWRKRYSRSDSDKTCTNIQYQHRLPLRSD